MSFSSKVKEEIINKDYNKHCTLAILLSYIYNSSILLKICNKQYFYFYFDNFLLAKKISYLLKNKYSIQYETLIRENIKTKKRYYFILIKSKKDILFLNSIKLNKNILKENCCKKTYLKENFMTNGSLSDPSKSYHIEFVYSYIKNAKIVCNILNFYNLNAKIIKRKNNFVVYIKEGENIVDILNLIKAHNSLMDLENVRILKDISNNINRKVNCETSNLSKTVKASIKQCDDIKYIFSKKGYKYLPPKLEEIAKVRLKYPDYSLKEISSILKYPISKSGVNHRLRKISIIAENLKKQN